jgi:hypothetical protein
VAGAGTRRRPVAALLREVAARVRVVAAPFVAARVRVVATPFVAARVRIVATPFVAARVRIVATPFISAPLGALTTLTGVIGPRPSGWRRVVVERRRGHGAGLLIGGFRTTRLLRSTPTRLAGLRRRTRGHRTG